MCHLMNINEKDQSNSFANIFISNLFKNTQRTSNNYQFDPIVNKFASVLNILAGHNAYEFIRMNLPGASPSTTTLRSYNQTISLRLTECEFRFDLLKDYLNSIGYNYVFSVGIVNWCGIQGRNWILLISKSGTKLIRIFHRVKNLVLKQKKQIYRLQSVANYRQF